MAIKIETFDELEVFIKDWKSFSDPYVYDYVGMITLFSACIDNIQKYFLDTEIEDFAANLTEKQKTFFIKFAEFVRANKDDE